MIVYQQVLQNYQKSFNILLGDDDWRFYSQDIVVSNSHDNVLLFQTFDNLTGINILFEMDSQVQSTAGNLGNVVWHFLEFML